MPNDQFSSYIMTRAFDEMIMMPALY